MSSITCTDAAGRLGVSMKTCSHPGCGRKHLARGWCASHYRHVVIEGGAPREIQAEGSPEERLWRRVRKTPTCWLWEGACNNKGYGVLGAQEQGKLLYTHRLSFELAHGPVPAGTEVCHTCDTPRCVNPAHLFAATHATNMQDMAEKGRSGAAVLDEATVREIVRLRKQGVSRMDIMQETGVRLGTLKDILKGKNWRHITGGPI